MTALAAPDYEKIVIPVDDLEWTRHWLGNRRCDLLVVEVARRPSLTTLVHIAAVESKSSEALAPIEVRPSEPPFDEAISQVVDTLDVISDLIAARSADHLVEDLKFSAFCQHLASVALAQLYPLQATDEGSIHVLKAISQLAARELKEDQLQLDGAVVVTQYKATIPMVAQRVAVSGSERDWEVTLVREGVKQLEALLGVVPEEGTATPVDGTQSAVAHRPATTGKEAIGGISSPSMPSGEALAVAPQVLGPIESAEAPAPVEEVFSAPRRPSDVVSAPGARVETSIANDLFVACRNRQFPVEAPDPEHVVLGSSLVAVPMLLAPGAQLRPIEASLPDLARELGVPSVSVENDPDRAYYVRFLVARAEADRTYPGLPSARAPFASADAYLGLYLGQTISGSDHVSYVSQWPHLLVGGTSGSGKTTFLRSLLEQVGRIDASLVRVAVVDGKGETDFAGAVPEPQFVSEFPKIVPHAEGALRVLQWVVTEEIPRRRAISNALVEEHPELGRNAKAILLNTHESGSSPFPVLLCVIDEFSQLMLSGGKDAEAFEDLVQQVAQVGRSQLVHLLLATQRPDASVIRGAVKANLNAKVALRLPTIADSMTILGGKGAERLLGQGDLLFQRTGDAPARLQGYKV